MKEKICKQCRNIVYSNYKLCINCYLENKKKNKLSLQERLKERNYIEDGIGIVTDSKGVKWELTLEEFDLVKDMLWHAVYSGSSPATSDGKFLYKFIGRIGNNKKKIKVTYKDKPKFEWKYEYKIIDDSRKKKNIMTIYMATSPSGKSYIGKTTEKLNNRISGHKKSTLKNHISKMGNAIRKYGVENFKWEVLDQTYDYDELNALEIYYIRFYNAIENGYNHQTGGDNGSFGLKSSPETIAKLSNRNHIKELIGIYNIEGDLIKTVKLAKEAAKFGNTTLSVVNHIIEGTVKQHNGYLFKRIDPDNIPKKLEFPKNHFIHKRMYEFDVYKNDEYVGRWNSQKTCSEDLKIPVTSINAMLNNKQKKCRDYVFQKV